MASQLQMLDEAFRLMAEAVEMAWRREGAAAAKVARATAIGRQLAEGIKAQSVETK